MRVYISGPISANPAYEKEFQEAEDRLRKRGYDVVNPVTITRHLLDKGLSPAELWRQCMITDIRALRECEMLVLLDRKGLESRGVDIEIRVARINGIRIEALESVLHGKE